MILSFEGNDSLVVVCLPEFFENIPTVCFGFVVLGLLVTLDWLPNTFEFLMHAQHEMLRVHAESPSSSRLIKEDRRRLCLQGRKCPTLKENTLLIIVNDLQWENKFNKPKWSIIV